MDYESNVYDKGRVRLIIKIKSDCDQAVKNLICEMQ